MTLSSRTAIGFLLGLLLAVPASASAQASPGEWLFHGGPTYVGTPNFAADHRGAGIQLGSVYGLPSFFTAGVDVSTARIFALSRDGEDTDTAPDAPPARRAWGHHSAFLGFGANVDIVEVVPWVQLAAGLQSGEQDVNQPARFALRGSLGFDVRPRRSWSTGAALQWSSFAPDWGSFPDHAVVSLRFSWILSPSAL